MTSCESVVSGCGLVVSGWLANRTEIKSVWPYCSSVNKRSRYFISGRLMTKATYLKFENLTY